MNFCFVMSLSVFIVSRGAEGTENERALTIDDTYKEMCPGINESLGVEMNLRLVRVCKQRRFAEWRDLHAAALIVHEQMPEAIRERPAIKTVRRYLLQNPPQFIDRRADGGIKELRMGEDDVFKMVNGLHVASTMIDGMISYQHDHEGKEG